MCGPRATASSMSELQMNIPELQSEPLCVLTSMGHMSELFAASGFPSAGRSNGLNVHRSSLRNTVLPQTLHTHGIITAKFLLLKMSVLLFRHMTGH